MDNIDDKLIEKAKKLLALAERGFGGEAANAQDKLESFLRKHNITYEDIMSEQRKDYEFFILKPHIDLFFKLCWHVIVNWSGKYRHRSGDKRYLFIQLTSTEYTELTILFDHYVLEYDKERLRMLRQFKKDFLRSFIHATELYAHESNVSDKPTRGSFDFDAMMRVANMLNNLKVNKHYKRLNS